MTSLIDRWTAPAEPERTQMTVPGRDMTQAAHPVWLGVPGCDPYCASPADYRLAAQLAVMRFALHVFGTEAARRDWGSSVAGKWLKWLLAATDEPDAYLRRYALRFACEEADLIGADGILRAAQQIHAACSLR